MLPLLSLLLLLLLSTNSQRLLLLLLSQEGAPRQPLPHLLLSCPLPPNLPEMPLRHPLPCLHLCPSWIVVLRCRDQRRQHCPNLALVQSSLDPPTGDQTRRLLLTVLEVPEEEAFGHGERDKESADGVPLRFVDGLGGRGGVGEGCSLGVGRRLMLSLRSRLRLSRKWRLSRGRWRLSQRRRVLDSSSADRLERRKFQRRTKRRVLRVGRRALPRPLLRDDHSVGIAIHLGRRSSGRFSDLGRCHPRLLALLAAREGALARGGW